jgi:diacylglycerol kinase (ATP)
MQDTSPTPLPEANPQKTRRGLNRILHAGGYSIQGLHAGWGETAFRQEAITGIESAVDRIGPEWHDLSKRAKDMGSAAVLLSLLLCAGVWLAALWQRFAWPAS